jgi:hypothetical protein
MSHHLYIMQKTPLLVAQEIKELLKENGMTLVVYKRHEDYVEEPSLDIHLVENKDQYDYMTFKHGPLIA